MPKELHPSKATDGTRIRERAPAEAMMLVQEPC
jgi:hypothetical protein